MSAIFPTGQPTFTDLDGDLTLDANNHSARHNKVHAELAAALAKIGINGSADTSTLDYKVTANAAAIASAAGTLIAHIANTSNPHSTTKAQVGLGNVDNTTDASKLAAALAAVYPIGSIYMEITGTNPATTFGFGTWVAFGAGSHPVGFLTGDADYGTVGTSGGNKKHWHWQTVGSDGTGIYARNAGVGAVPQNTEVVTVDRFAAGGSHTSAGARLEGTEYNSDLPPFIVVYMWKRTA